MGLSIDYIYVPWLYILAYILFRLYILACDGIWVCT